MDNKKIALADFQHHITRFYKAMDGFKTPVDQQPDMSDFLNEVSARLQPITESRNRLPRNRAHVARKVQLANIKKEDDEDTKNPFNNLPSTPVPNSTTPLHTISRIKEEPKELSLNNIPKTALIVRISQQPAKRNRRQNRLNQHLERRIERGQLNNVYTTLSAANRANEARQAEEAANKPKLMARILLIDTNFKKFSPKKFAAMERRRQEVADALAAAVLKPKYMARIQLTDANFKKFFPKTFEAKEQRKWEEAAAAVEAAAETARQMVSNWDADDLSVHNGGI